jgi:hypothetical protein
MAVLVVEVELTVSLVLELPVKVTTVAQELTDQWMVVGLAAAVVAPDLWVKMQLAVDQIMVKVVLAEMELHHQFLDYQLPMPAAAAAVLV